MSKESVYDFFAFIIFFPIYWEFKNILIHSISNFLVIWYQQLIATKIKSRKKYKWKWK